MMPNPPEPLALAVPLSRFTSQVGGGSAFFVIVLFKVRSPAADSLVKPAVFGRSNSNSNVAFPLPCRLFHLTVERAGVRGKRPNGSLAHAKHYVY